VGLYGKKFMFLKFRTMYVGNDSRVHEEYIKKLIAGKIDAESGDGASQKPVYKITNDKRVTPIGEFLRKTSLDELPQFINVLLGDMSLVGPRPPIPYEVQNYDIWHRCRVVEVKPGITGLWQVMGRSTTSFDEMVRLDIKYSREWSIWLDLKIIAKTPWSVIKGKGAY
jgi:lipopolysaccharide/colanic/teichoic acid biosynthesis glycosyltransferase